MIKNENGITMGALIITIIVILIVASIGLGAINYNHINVLETADKIVKDKSYQDYKDAAEMVISEAQLKLSTKTIDDNYFDEIIKILKNSGQFEDAKSIKPVHYEKIGEKIYTEENPSSLINAVEIWTKEDYRLIINEDLNIYDAKEKEYVATETAAIEFSGIPENWTNKNVAVTIKKGGAISSDSSYTILYKIGTNSDYQKYNKVLDIPENCIIYAKIVDNFNRVIAPETKGIVNKIDKINPKINDFQVIANCSSTEVTVNAEDNESGINKITVYAKKSGSSNTITKEIDIQSKKISLEIDEGIYDIYVEVSDNAGNVSKSDTKQVNAKEHNYAYFKNGTENVGKDHPTAEGYYKYKCANGCSAGQSDHTIEINKDKDASQHYIYKCSCGKNQTENHIPENVGTKDVHTRCSTCKRVLSSTHTMTNVKTASVCQQCNCGYKITTHTPVNGGTKEVHKKCSVCNYTIEGNDKHSTYTKSETAAQGCKDGKRVKACACGYTYDEVIKTTGTHELAFLVHGSKSPYTSYYYSTKVPKPKFNSSGKLIVSKTYHPYTANSTISGTSFSDPFYVVAGDYRLACKYCGGYWNQSHKVTVYSSAKKNAYRHNYKVSCSYCGAVDGTTHSCIYGCTNLSSGCGPRYGGNHVCSCGATKRPSSSKWTV